MAFTIIVPEGNPNSPTVTVDRRLWLTEDRNHVVEDGDVRARFLLAAGPGATMDRADAERLGLIHQQAKQAEKPQDKAQAKPEDKSRARK